MIVSNGFRLAASLLAAIGATLLTIPAASAQFCSASAGNCQELVGTTIADPRTSDIIGGNFTVADNFQPNVSGSISSICFYGYYGPGIPAGSHVPAAGNEAFRITVWQSTATGLPGTMISRIFVGANADAGQNVPAYTGSLSRGSALGTPSSLAGTQLYAWTASSLAIPVTAHACYWLEIVAVTSGLDTNSRWRWVNTTQTTGPASPVDGLSLQLNLTQSLPDQYSYTNIINTADRAFCITIGSSSNILTLPSCGIPPVPSNSVCDSALTLGDATNPLPYTAPANTGNYRSTTALTPFCGLNLVNSNTLWYKVVGDGTTLTASTCGPDTNFDTVINVYCLASGASDCGQGNSNLLCVANNDSGPAACTGDNGPDTDPSIVSWPTKAGDTYYIAVFGNFANKFIGALSFSLTSDGTQVANPPSCVSDSCPVDLNTITGISEPDVCGGISVDHNGACDGATVMQFSLGDTVKGRISADAPANGLPANSRDLDWWEYNTATPLPDNSNGVGQCNLKITWQTELPTVLWFFTNPCTSTDPGVTTAAFIGRYRGTTDGVLSDGACGPFSAVILTLANAPLRMLVTTPDFGGAPCQSVGNNYAVKIELAPVGACCVPNIPCQAVALGTCFSQGGAYAGDGVACSTLPCPGACCTSGACTVADSRAACNAGSGTYMGEGVACDSIQCPVVVGVCCRGSTCNASITQANCHTSGVLAGAHYSGGTTICAGGDFSHCCFADYNKVNGIEIQDIFDFLNDWFNLVPYANTGSDGTTPAVGTQSIFDFLNSWFAGCAP
ncbi:MAG TPA: hypothetical protein VHC70_01670 [Phycisphaerales bacterium]|nr:hypothetical protein [Phycisphaerales bacterium]